MNQTTGDDFQNQYNQGGKFAKQLNEIATAMKGGSPEHEPASAEVSASKPVEEIREILTEPELEKKPELEGYTEKIEKAAELTKPVVDDYTAQVLLGSANPLSPVVKLPLTESQIEEGLHHKIWESIRWLAEWCVRQVKLLHGKVTTNL